MIFQVVDVSETGWIAHDGVSKLDGSPGRGSGRYPLGSGKRPFRHQVEGTSSAVKRETVKDAKENLNKKQNKTLRERLFGKKTIPANEKKVSEMTAEELREAKERNNLEKDYIESKTNLIKASTAYNELIHQPTILERGKKAAGKVLSSVAVNIATQVGNELAAKGINELIGYDLITTKDKKKDKAQQPKQKQTKQAEQEAKEGSSKEAKAENARSEKNSSSSSSRSNAFVNTAANEATKSYAKDIGQQFVNEMLYSEPTKLLQSPNYPQLPPPRMR